MDKEGQTKPAKPWLAALLTLIMPGAGHYYAGVSFGFAFTLAIVFGLFRPLAFVVATQFVSVWRAAFLAALLSLIPFIGLLVHSVWNARLVGSNRPRRQRMSFAPFLLLTIAENSALLHLGGDATTRHYKNFHVPTASMEPTILVGDHILCDLKAYSDTATPQHGDIVVVEWPTPTGVPYVKRVSGLPGERINDHEVPAGSYFVVGDNLAHSLDSRTKGAVDRRSIKGKVVGVLYSQDADHSIRWDRFFRDVP